MVHWRGQRPGVDPAGRTEVSGKWHIKTVDQVLVISGVHIRTKTSSWLDFSSHLSKYLHTCPRNRIEKSPMCLFSIWLGDAPATQGHFERSRPSQTRCSMTRCADTPHTPKSFLFFVFMFCEKVLQRAFCLFRSGFREHLQREPSIFWRLCSRVCFLARPRVSPPPWTGTSIARRHPLIQGNGDKKRKEECHSSPCFYGRGWAASSSFCGPPFRFEMCLLFFFIYFMLSG